MFPTFVSYISNDVPMIFLWHSDSPIESSTLYRVSSMCFSQALHLEGGSAGDLIVSWLVWIIFQWYMIAIII